MTGIAEADYFMDRSLVEDPYPYFEALRAKGPAVCLPAHNTVAVVDHELAVQVYLDTGHYSSINAVTGPLPPMPFAPEGDDISPQIEAIRPQFTFGEEVLTADLPRHTPQRSLMMRLFTPRRLKEMEPAIARIASQLIDEIAGKGSCDFPRDFGSPFASMVIAELLGVPAEDRQEFREKLGNLASEVGNDDGKAVINPLDYRLDKFTRYIEERRRAPCGDILSDLATAAYPDGSEPPVLEAVHVASLLFGAGQDTTAIFLGNALAILAGDKALQGRLRADPSLIPDFIEEVLRHSGPVKASFRLARRPVTVAGVAVDPGATVMLSTAAVNRDPKRFDDPAAFRLGRKGVKEHLSFGRGIHTCPGAALSRTESRLALELLLARFSDIAFDPAHHGHEANPKLDYVPSYVFRKLAHLHLRLEPAE